MDAGRFIGDADLSLNARRPPPIEPPPRADCEAYDDPVTSKTRAAAARGRRPFWRRTGGVLQSACKKYPGRWTIWIVHGAGMAREGQDGAYQRAAAEFGAALERLARGYERDAESRRDLLQDLHFALWRSFAHFDGRCSLRTWVYRVAHNAAASYVSRQRRTAKQESVGLDDIADLADAGDPERDAGDRQDLAKLSAHIARLKTPDRELILLYLEGLEAAEIGEITGLSPGAAATRIHRIKALFKRSFQ
jgi:RNA polymerase sigma-70 factor (ECF subfamily)